jgi:Ser/Thr protein kinase RdoA (MazF antagonist)
MNVRDAICAMAAVRPPANQRPLCDRVLKRLDRLLNEIPVRAQALAEHGGPQTLLHGDLWAINVFVMPGASGPAARLIDWDHAAAGPLSYDLSTFLLRFHSTARAGVLALYAESLGRAGWQLPAARDLNLLFETAELARYANRIIWPAIALAHEGTEWGFQELKEVEEWFENLAPVLAIEPSAQPEPVLP